MGGRGYGCGWWGMGMVRGDSDSEGWWDSDSGDDGIVSDTK